jgi:hypothetical protein
VLYPKRSVRFPGTSWTSIVRVLLPSLHVPPALIVRMSGNDKLDSIENQPINENAVQWATQSELDQNRRTELSRLGDIPA